MGGAELCVLDSPRCDPGVEGGRYAQLMSSSPDLERKVRRHDNDLEAIYEILTDHREDLVQIKATLAEHGSILAEHGSKLDELLALLRGRE